MANDKMTIREGFERARAHYAEIGDAEMVAFFDKRIEQVVKKNSTERKPTAKQVANEGIKTAIAEWMERGVAYAAADVSKSCPACESLAVQRVSALLSQMVKSGVLTVTEDKRKHLYSIAE
jgi:hypothetical protein